jgi:diguanylate cyclase (GGDEF)-like protein/PAS domain S-box-containing protein
LPSHERRSTNAHAIEAGFFAPSSDGELATRLADLEARYRGLIDNLPAVFYIDDVSCSDMVDISPGVEALFGYTPEQWREVYEDWGQTIHPDDRDRIAAESERCVASGEPYRVEYRGVHADGHTVWVREDAVLIRDEEGNGLYWLGMMLDITELMVARDDLREATSAYGALVEQIPAIVYQDVADESWTTAYVSPQLTKILGVQPDEWTGESKLWSEMLHPEDRDRAIEEVDAGIASGAPYSVEYRMIARDGRVVWFQDTATILPDAGGRPAYVQGVMLDVTERKEAEDRLAYLAYHDMLTGLPNRAMFDELLELALARARRHDRGVAVVTLDLDDFKLVNDSLGHEAGDRLIAMVADRLTDDTRETDLIARQGGDEFLLLLADVDRSSPLADADGIAIAAESVAVRVQQALAAPFLVDGTELYVTASMGIALWPRDGEGPAELLRSAEAAMFAAKTGDPGRFMFHVREGADALSKLSLSTRLRKAVEQRVWALHYQPLVDLHDGTMFGVEALIRWPDPSGSLVPPGEFIPLAEEMGLIDAIGQWVVEEVCRQDELWRAEGLQLEIGFNLSPRQLSEVDPVGRIAALIAAAGMDPNRLTVEITESTAMHDPDRIIDLLRGFKDRGFRLAIDDFGTGYSSLARLRYMPVDILKIDRTFIREVHNDPQSASMVSAIIALADNLGMQPLAEGIETAEEWGFLAERGCAYGQGYYFSRPVPAEEITAMHRRRGLRLVDGELAV